MAEQEWGRRERSGARREREAGRFVRLAHPWVLEDAPGGIQPGHRGPRVRKGKTRIESFVPPDSGGPGWPRAWPDINA
ncbi:hypothetical protein KM043_001352 [Ampulex compressa]|nr:hypothetical protein KM043_001352 [Ampulex compressa]